MCKKYMVVVMEEFIIDRLKTFMFKMLLHYRSNVWNN